MLLDTQSLVAELASGAPSSATVSDTPRSSAARWARDIAVEPGADLWVFAYGSLMWNPEIPFVDSQPAVIGGYHRRFCVSSHRYRGTPERPGLVLGLDRGGSCRGIAFRVAAADVPMALDVLWEREMINRVYQPRMVPVRLGGGRGTVAACTFVVDRAHCQYCGCLDEGTMADRIAGCRGERGPNIDYLANTVAHLEELGIHDKRLSSLLAAVNRRLG